MRHLITQEPLAWFWQNFVLDVLACPPHLFYAVYKLVFMVWNSRGNKISNAQELLH
jgi:hypothetical protein